MQNQDVTDIQVVHPDPLHHCNNFFSFQFSVRYGTVHHLIIISSHLSDLFNWSRSLLSTSSDEGDNWNLFENILRARMSLLSHDVFQIQVCP